MSTVREDTKEQIVKAGHALFMKHGIRRVSVEDICKRAQLSKMTFYRSFKNKLDLVEKVLIQIAEEGMQSFQKLVDQDIPFKEKVPQLIALKRDKTEAVSKEFIEDIYQHQPEMMDMLQEYSQKSMDLLKKELKLAQKKGEINKNFKLDFVLYLLQDIQAKFSDEQFLGIFESVQDASVELTQFLFYGLVGEDDA